MESMEQARNDLYNIGFDPDQISDGIVVYHPQILSIEVLKHQMYLLTLEYKSIEEYNEWSVESKTRRIMDQVRFIDEVTSSDEDIELIDGHTPKAREAAIYILDTLCSMEGCSEMFPYDFAEETAREFNIKNPFA